MIKVIDKVQYLPSGDFMNDILNDSQKGIIQDIKQKVSRINESNQLVTITITGKVNENPKLDVAIDCEDNETRLKIKQALK